MAAIGGQRYHSTGGNGRARSYGPVRRRRAWKSHGFCPADWPPARPRCTCQICDCPTRDVGELVNTRGEVLHVGQAVDISGSRNKPGVVLSLHAGELPKHHRALVRYDGDDPTPAHVMAHQCRPRLDGPAARV